MDQPLVEHRDRGRRRVSGFPGGGCWTVRNFSDAHFTVVHALDLAPAFAQLGDDTGEMYDQARLRVAALLQDKWVRPFIDGGVSFDVFVDEGGPAELLLGAAAKNAADLVVVGRRDHFPFAARWEASASVSSRMRRPRRQLFPSRAASAELRRPRRTMAHAAGRRVSGRFVSPGSGLEFEMSKFNVRHEALPKVGDLFEFSAATGPTVTVVTHRSGRRISPLPSPMIDFA